MVLTIADIIAIRNKRIIDLVLIAQNEITLFQNYITNNRIIFMTRRIQFHGENVCCLESVLYIRFVLHIG